MATNNHHTTNTAPTPSTDTTRILGPYLGTIAALSAATQVIIATYQGYPTWVSSLGTVAIAATYAWLLWRHRATLQRIRFGHAVAHAATFVVVTMPYQAHYYLSALTSDGFNPGHVGAWTGPALAMPAFWGIGLAIHLASAVASRGFENT